MPVFRTLTKFKGLRGTPFDVFGYSTERKQERKLIKTYKSDIKKLMKNLDDKNYSMAVELASIPELVRGFGHVKEQHLHAALSKRDELWAHYNKDVVDSKKAA